MKLKNGFFKQDFFKSYIKVAPLPLAIERSWECEILSSQIFNHPILDIGCGEGIFALNLFDEKIDVGIEPNAKELERTALTNCYTELIECYGDKIPKEDNFFKTIFSNSVLEHIEDVESVLIEIKRLLGDGGVVFLTLPTDKFDQYSVGYQFLSFIGLKNFASKYAMFFNGFWRHYHCYNKSRWEVIFDRCGFKVKNSFEYGSKFQCVLNSLFSPLCIFSFVIKKLTNRWFLFSLMRSFFVKVFHVPLFSSLARLKVQAEGKGGLIYFVLEKK